MTKAQSRFSQAQPINESIWVNLNGRNVLLSAYKGVRGARLYFDWCGDGVANVYDKDFKKVGKFDVYNQD